jgi:hypothetical protein
MLLPFSYPDFVAGVHCHVQRARASGCVAQRTEEGAYPVLLFVFVTDRRRQYAEDQYKLNTTAHVSQLNRAIVAGVEAGIFVQPKVCGAPALIIYLPDLRQGPSGCLKLAPKAPRDASKEVRPDFFYLRRRLILSPELQACIQDRVEARLQGQGRARKENGW